MEEQKSLETLYSESEEYFTSLISEGNYDESKVQAAIETICSCQRIVEVQSLFSRNEELDEYSTKSLKFLNLRYFLGKIYSINRNLLTRRSCLLQARSELRVFLEDCVRLRIMEEDEIAEFEEGGSLSSMSAADKRNLKIAKYKREKAANERMQATKLIIQSKKRSANEADETGVFQFDIEEELRELTILQLQSYARDSLNELSMLDQEITLLGHMEDLRELEDISDQGESTGGASQGPSSVPGLPRQVDPPYRPGQGPGISVTRTEKIGDQLVMSRDVVKAGVFQPHISAPTISLEEFGDMQLAEAMERQAREADAATAGESAVPRRYEQLLADGDEDSHELVDKATLADREWDNWKEHNPKGSGNKLGKRF